jgi:hypothetical protein
MGANAPRYVSPKERADNRARLIRFGYGLVVAIPAGLALIMSTQGTFVPPAGCPRRHIREAAMAEGGSGGVGILGVLIGALLVIMVGGGILYATGAIGGGGHTTTLKVEVPKVGK